MAYFNGKEIIFSPKINITGGIDKDFLSSEINERTENIFNYVPVQLTNINYVNPAYTEAVFITEEMVKNGLYMLRIAEGIQDVTPYLVSGENVNSLENEKTMTLPQIGKVAENLIDFHELYVGYVISKEQNFEKDGCIFVTTSNVQCVTKENLDNILDSM